MALSKSREDGSGVLGPLQDAFSLRNARRGDTSYGTWLDEFAARAAAGDTEAFESIYNATVDDIFAYLNGQLRGDQAAEDLTANTFLKAWTSARSYRKGSNNYLRWLFAIARNELRDHWRRNRANLTLTEDHLAMPSDGSAEADAAGTGRLVGWAMERLNDEQRQVVALRFFNEMSHAEIASILDKREGAVRAQLLRALRRMRKAMNDAAP